MKGMLNMKMFYKLKKVVRKNDNKVFYVMEVYTKDETSGKWKQLPSYFLSKKDLELLKD